MKGRKEMKKKGKMGRSKGRMKRGKDEKRERRRKGEGK